eukprot:3935417-Amphidinium_carterae.3
MGRVQAEAQAIMAQLKSAAAAAAAAANPTFVHAVDNPQHQPPNKPTVKQQRQQSAKSDPYTCQHGSADDPPKKASDRKLSS